MKKRPIILYTCMIIVDTLIISYLPANTLLQIFSSVVLMAPISLGICALADYRKHDFRFSILDVFICLPFLFLIIDYLIWNGWVRIVTNIFVVLFSTVGVHTSLNIKIKNLTN